MDELREPPEGAANPPVDSAACALSVVVPAYNEEDNVAELYERITKTLADSDYDYEILFVDDGSTDGTYGRLREIHQRDPRVRVLRFVRNFGQQMAVLAGFRQARGAIVVLIDADMQTLPEDIPLLLEKFDGNVDLVCGVRGRRSDPLIRKLGSRFVSNFLSGATGAKMDGGIPGFIALRRELAQNACRFDQHNSFLIGTIAWLSVGRIASVTVRHESRRRGRSKYTLGKLTELTFNLICNFSLAPLRLSFFIGIPITVASFLAFVWMIVGALISPNQILQAPEWFLIVAMGFLGGVQLIVLGVLGEYVGRVYGEVRQRPRYVVREFLE